MKETLGFMAFLLIPAALAYGSDFLKWLITQLLPQSATTPQTAVVAPRMERPRRTEAVPEAAVASAVAAVVQATPTERADPKRLTESELEFQLHEASKQRREAQEPVVVPPEEYVAPTLSAADLRDFDYADFRTHEQHS